jgi:predicted kinase
MYIRETFYKTKDWQGLMLTLKRERLNERGEIICAHCGKPIVKSYDCIGHHTIPLTDDNVNDIYISLNPDLIELVHHGCHNKIHCKLGYAERRVYIVYGSPLSGKSTYVKDSANKGDLIMDIDSIWQCISGCDRYVKPGKVKAVVFAVRDSILECIRYRRGKWVNAYVIGGYPLLGERQRKVKELGAEEIYISATKEQCLERLEVESNGHGSKRDLNEWKEYIDDWWNKYQGYY